MVLVDVLRFTTALDVATSAGARVFPAPWPYEPTVGPPEGAELADGTGPRALTLSPASLRVLGSGDTIMLPSANGSHCSALAAGAGVAVVGGSLRNAAAVARHVIDSSTKPVAIVACGERWPDTNLRPALEDMIGAGAIVHALSRADPGCSVSPEAAASAAVFGAMAHDLPATLAECVSGRQLCRVGPRGRYLLGGGAGCEWLGPDTGQRRRIHRPPGLASSAWPGGRPRSSEAAAGGGPRRARDCRRARVAPGTRVERHLDVGRKHRREDGRRWLPGPSGPAAPVRRRRAARPTR